MAEVTRYVDPDVVAGDGSGDSWVNAYASLNAWEAGEQTNLVSDGNTHTVHLRASAGTDDTTLVDILGWTTDTTHLITIIQDDFPADGIFDETKYLLNNNDSNSYLIKFHEDFIHVDGLQGLVQSSTVERRGFWLATGTSGGELIFSDVIIKGSASGTANTYLLISDSGWVSTVDIYNSIFFGLPATETSGQRSILWTTGTMNLYNSTIYGGFYGINRSSGTVTATNCAIGNTSNDFNGTITADYNASDDGDGTNAVGPLGGDWTNEFNDPANGDFSLKAGGNCIDNGTNSGAPSDDIIGTSRPQDTTTDIGAFEFVAASGIVILRRRMENA